MRKNIQRTIYLVIVVASLLAMAVLVWNRHRAEEQSKSVEMVLDYDEFALLADQLGMKREDLFLEMREAGFPSVAIKEETLFQMAEENAGVDYALYRVFRRDIDWAKRVPAAAADHLLARDNEWDVVVRVRDAELFTRLVSALSVRYGGNFFQAFESEGDAPWTIVLHGTIGDALITQSSALRSANDLHSKSYRIVDVSLLEDIGLGYDPVKIAIVQSAGLAVHLRPANYTRAEDPDQLVAAYLADVERFGAQRDTILFQGSSVLGYDASTGQYAQSLYDYMHDGGVRAGLVEAADQLGFIKMQGSQQLAADLNYNVIRVYPVVEYVQLRYNYLDHYEKSKEIENTLYRAITERNIRLVYMRPFKINALEFQRDLGEYRVMMDRLASRLARHSIRLGEAEAIPYNHVRTVFLFVMSAGVAAFGLLILKLVFGLRGWPEAVLMLLSLLVTGIMVWKMPARAVQLYSFAATVIFPMLSAVFLIEYMKDSLLSRRVERTGGLVRRSLIGFTVSVLISFVGGLYVAAYLSRPDYLVEMSYFRGVKASLLLPLVLTLILYLIKMGLRRTTPEGDATNYQDVKQFLLLDVKMYYLFLAAALGGVAYLYLARSGNTSGVEVFDAELMLRIFFEEHLLARPRTKEIFLAYPALFAALFAAARGYKQVLLPLLLAAMVGLTSILNTFCHSRTPVYLSIYRNGISFLISIVVGIVLVVLLERIRIWINRATSKADATREASQ